MDTCQIVGLQGFCDIIAPKRTSSDLLWASKKWVPSAVYRILVKSRWKTMPSIVMNSFRLITKLQEISEENGIDLEMMQTEAFRILDQMAYRRVEPILRWLAYCTAKFYKQIFVSIYVNEWKIFKAMSQMGKNPVLFMPTHKSYIDFTLIAYLSFHYDMDIPRTAAGMDFYSMRFVGRLIRDCCAFFIRRTFTSDKLYSSIFSEYVQTLITYEDAPIEFFIEGTRSRSQKSLVPKYGFLTEAITPFLLGKVPDISIIPINICYDRVLEEVLHVYEMLGVPKPKESTKGLYKALRFLKSSYGSIFLQFGDAISVREFFSNEIDRSIHNHGPVSLQNPTAKELKEIKRLAHSVVYQQQNLTILTCFNLIATVVNHHIMEVVTPLSVDNLVAEVSWLVDIFRRLGVKVAVERNIAGSVSKNLALHKSFVSVSDGKVKLLRIHSLSGKIDRSKMKAHLLSEKAMDVAVPLLLLQYYTNPCAHFLVNLTFIVLIIESSADKVSLDNLSSHFEFLRSVYSNEFAFFLETEKKDFESALTFCKKEKAIVRCGTEVRLSENVKFRKLCISFFRNYLLSYLCVTDVLMKATERQMSLRSIQVAYQECVESHILLGTPIHPAGLSLELVGNAVQSFTRMGALTKNLRENSLSYEVHHEILQTISDHLSMFARFYGKVDLSEHFTNFVMGKL